jgi:colicin import membrane protein
VKRAWIRPPSARAGIECVVRITQTTGGEVTGVSVGDCNGDAAVRASIEDAVYRASPLPPAPDPAIFDRNLTFNFKPTD